jgi:pimeloyl-ACP methyl ester carboxylesterase
MVFGSTIEWLAVLHQWSCFSTEVQEAISKAVWPDLTRLTNRFTVIMYDQRGGGRSQIIGETSRLTANDHVHDLEAIRVAGFS